VKLLCTGRSSEPKLSGSSRMWRYAGTVEAKYRQLQHLSCTNNFIFEILLAFSATCADLIPREHWPGACTEIVRDAGGWDWLRLEIRHDKHDKNDDPSEADTRACVVHCLRDGVHPGARGDKSCGRDGCTCDLVMGSVAEAVAADARRQSPSPMEVHDQAFVKTLLFRRRNPATLS